MMDHERTEKELQEIFEEIQGSYRSFVEEAFALQERTLALAGELLGAERGTRDVRAEFDALTAGSGRQRERFERLARKASEAYMKVLLAPTDYHHKVQEAKADLEDASPS